MTTPRKIGCLRCGHPDLQPGFIAESASRGTYAQWHGGELDVNWTGAVKHWSQRERYTVIAQRCPQCGQLDLSTGAYV